MNFVFFGNGRPNEKKASAEIFSLLGITAKIYTEGFYPNIFTLASEHYKQTGKGGVSGYKKLFELQDSLISYISEGDAAAVNAIYDIIAEKVSNEEPRLAAQIFSNILTICESKLSEAGVSIAGCFGDENYKNSGNMRETVIKMAEFTAKNKVSGRHVTEQAKRYAEQNFDKDITLADCAAKFYLNAAYFSKLFKEKAGISFTDYMVSFRMKKAMLYLCNPNYKVYEICNMVGYKTERYFYKVFREYTGLTPTEYRKRNVSPNV
jgi:two-component system response regulator YesN